MFFRKREVSALFLATAIPIGSVAFGGELSYPQRPITIVVGFPPGGPTDPLARIVANAMATELGQKVLIENRPGAAGNVAAAAVSRATRDGHTLYFATRANVLNEFLYDQVEYTVRKDFAPVGLLATVPNVLVVGKNAPVSDVAALTARAQANPGKLSCASGGVGSTSHVMCELFQAATGTKMLHVPYRGAGPALMDLITAQVDAKFDSLPSALPHIRRGDLRALGVLSSGRSRFAPDIPTLAEAGGPDLVVESWYGLLAPAGTPPEILKRLNQSLNVVLSSDDLQRLYARQGYMPPPQPNTREAFETLLAAESEKWGGVVRTRGIKPY